MGFVAQTEGKHSALTHRYADFVVAIEHASCVVRCREQNAYRARYLQTGGNRLASGPPRVSPVFGSVQWCRPGEAIGILRELAVGTQARICHFLRVFSQVAHMVNGGKLQMLIVGQQAEAALGPLFIECVELGQFTAASGVGGRRDSRL